MEDWRNKEFLLCDKEGWLPFIFSLQCHPWIKHLGHESKGNDHQLKKLFTSKEILLTSTIGDV